MISIIVPIYQVEEYIEDCLNSLLQQSYRNIEIICVNDCTLDNSVTIVKEFQKKDDRIRLINHEENRGLGGARNTGIQHAEGDYILFIDSDDYVDTTMVEKLYHSMIEADSDASVCGVMLTNYSSHEFTPHTAFHYDELATQQVYDLSKSKEVLTNMWPSAWNKLFKASIINANTIRFRERILYEDHTFFYEYFSHCKSFSYINAPLYYYRQQRPNSITTQSVGREKEIFTILEYVSSIFKDMYPLEQYNSLFAKIVVRLLYERRWIFNESDPNYYTYLRNVSEYLEKWDKDFLIQSKDTFIYETDPVFLTKAEIDILEKKSCTRSRQSTNYSIKNILLNIPLIKQAISTRNALIRIRNDYYWYLEQTYSNTNKLNDYLHQKLDSTFQEQSFDQRLDYLKKLDTHAKMSEQSVYQLTQCLEDIKVQFHSSLGDLTNQLDNLSHLTNMMHIEERFSNIEATLNSYKKKVDESWWLTWNIHDRLPDTMGSNTNNSSFLQYYPTWIPCEYPEYFKGNTWHWADNFKLFNISNNGDCSKELNLLFNNFSSEDIHYLKILWERNTKIIPYASYCDEQGYLLKKDFIFTPSELLEQDKIFHSYSAIISNYILPEGITYEIPVFYYAHGLKTMSKAALSFINHGDILDLGGFIGDSALILSEYTFKTVFTVEMNHSNIKTMQMVLCSNHCQDNIITIEGAVGDEDTLQAYYGDSSYSTLNDMSDDAIYKKRVNVPVHRVDTLVSQYNIEPHFIKIDVEGAEYKAILGAEETIKKYRPILCISIYHTAVDFLFIKPLIESWNLRYKFHIENHNPFDPIYEKMLICTPDEYV